VTRPAYRGDRHQTFDQAVGVLAEGMPPRRRVQLRPAQAVVHLAGRRWSLPYLRLEVRRG